ncbi:MAG: hypothetical protein ACSHX0_10200 [Akkermansiaceae bacterium]
MSYEVFLCLEALAFLDVRKRLAEYGGVMTAGYWLTENDSLDWLSGLPEQKPTSGLMLGDAGISYYSLNLCDPVGVPSLLRQ